jgi:hypothetical protein
VESFEGIDEQGILAVKREFDDAEIPLDDMGEWDLPAEPRSQRAARKRNRLEEELAEAAAKLEVSPRP